MFSRFCCLLILLFNLKSLSAQERGNIVLPFKKSQSSPLKGDSGSRKAALVVGISDYSSSKLTLKYASKDAGLIFNYLTGVRNFPKENIFLLPDSLATSGRIYNAILDLMKWLVSGDELVLYFAGHGDVQTVADFDEAFFLAWDASDSRNYHGAAGTLKLSDLELYTNRLAANKKVKVSLVMDACHAGYDLYKDGVLKAQENISGSFNNINKFLGCAVNEFSYEADSIGHGLFSWYLVQGMMGLADEPADNVVTYDELKKWTQSKVSGATRGKQNPVVTVPDYSLPALQVTAESRAAALNYFRNKQFNGMLAGRGAGGDDTLISVNLQQVIDKYNRFLLRENLYGSDSTCLGVLQELNAIKSQAGKELKQSLHNHLAEALETRSQLVLNEYLKGKSELPPAAVYYRASVEASLADSLLEPDDPRKKNIQVMSAFHKAFSYIRYERFENYAEAEQLLRNALDIENRAAYIYVAISYLMEYQHKYDSAIYYAKKAEEIIPTWSHPKNILGNLHADILQYEKALEYHRSVLQLDSSYVWSYNNIGVAMLDMDRLTEAEYYFKKSLQMKKATGKQRLNRDWAISYTNLGAIMEERGLVAKAIEYYNMADSIDATYTKSMRNRALLYKNNNGDNVEDLLKKAIATMPYEAENYYELATFYKENFKDKQDQYLADSLYRKAIILNPFNEAYYDGLALLNIDKAQPDSALYWLQQGLKYSAGSAEAYYNLGYYYQLVNKKDSALHFYATAFSKNPYALGIADVYADALLQKADTAAAVLVMMQSQAKHPKAPKSYYQAGNFYFKMGQYKKAALAYSNCLKADSSYLKAYQSLAYVTLLSGQDSESRGYMKQLLPLNNNPEPILQYMNAVAEQSSKIPIAKRLQWLQAFCAIDARHELVNELIAATAYHTGRELHSVFSRLKKTEDALEYSNPILVKWLLLLSVELNNSVGIKMYSGRYLDETLNTEAGIKALALKMTGNLKEAGKIKATLDPAALRGYQVNFLKMFKGI